MEHKHICEQCGKEFISKKLKQKFCSVECRVESTKKRIKTNCDYCNKEILVVEGVYVKNKHNYCSQKCKSEHQKSILKGENNPNYKGKTIEIECEYCHKKFYRYEWDKKLNTHNYCSQECKAKHQEVILLGENNPNYNNRGSDNPLWKENKPYIERQKDRSLENYKFFKKEVFERDNYTCQICGDNKGGNLNVHHLNSYDWCIEERTKTSNGITLCEKCHKNFHNIYGYGNNKKEQFEEFIKNHDNTEVIQETKES